VSSTKHLTFENIQTAGMTRKERGGKKKKKKGERGMPKNPSCLIKNQIE